MTPVNWSQVIWWLIFFPLGGLVFLSIAGFIPPRWRWFDIASQFRVQYIVLSLILGCISSVFTQWNLTIMAGSIILINLLVVWPWIVPWKIRNYKQDHSDKGYKGSDGVGRLLLANILRKNRAFEALINLAGDSRADLIALVEPDQKWMNSLESLREDYPYQHAALRNDNYGLALLSRRPLRDCEVLFLTDQGTPTIHAIIDWNGKPVNIYVTHPAPPKSQRELKFRQDQMDSLAKLINGADENTILCGDFNCSAWTKALLNMTRQASIVDSSRGFGWLPTWPVDRWYLGVMIDHVLVSRNLDIIRRWRGPDIGSDHWPVLIDFIIKEY